MNRIYANLFLVLMVTVGLFALPRRSNTLKADYYAPYGSAMEYSYSNAQSGQGSSYTGTFDPYYAMRDYDNYYSQVYPDYYSLWPGPAIADPPPAGSPSQQPTYEYANNADPYYAMKQYDAYYSQIYPDYYSNWSNIQERPQY